MEQDRKDELLLMANIFVNVTLNGEPAVKYGLYECFYITHENAGEFEVEA